MFNAAQSGEGFRQVIKEMAAAGVVGKRGRSIKYPQIYEILRNEKYTGVYLYSPHQEKKRSERRTKANAIRVEDAIPAIISKEQFKEVQIIMKKEKSKQEKISLQRFGILSVWRKNVWPYADKNGHTYHYYVCSKRCGSPVVQEEEVNSAAKISGRTSERRKSEDNCSGSA